MAVVVGGVEMAVVIVVVKDAVVVAMKDVSYGLGCGGYGETKCVCLWWSWQIISVTVIVIAEWYSRRNAIMHERSESVRKSHMHLTTAEKCMAGRVEIWRSFGGWVQLWWSIGGWVQLWWSFGGWVQLW